MIKYVLVVLLSGVVAGYANNMWGSVLVDGCVSYLFDAALLFLLFLMGLTFGLDREAMGKLRRAGVKILVFPCCIAVGSILGGLVGGFVLGIDVVGSMVVSAGFGWYTLAGPLVGQLFGAELGVLGFAVNFLRELLTIVGVSLWVRVDKYGGVAAGGATAMDTTLPVVVKFGGNDVLMAAFLSGFVLSLLAPLVITVIASVR